MRRRVLVLVLWAVALADAPGAAPPALETRVFTLHYRSVDDAALLVRPRLSEEAKVSMEPKLRSLTITDWPSNVAEVAQAIASFDVPPKSVEVVVKLLRASHAPDPRPIADELAAIRDAVRPVADYESYEKLGEVRLSGVEGADLSAAFGPKDAYRVSFRIGVADDRNGIVRFDGLALDRRASSPAGAYTTVMKLTFQARAGEPMVIGATTGSTRNAGVFLVMEPVIHAATDGSRVATGKDR